MKKLFAVFTVFLLTNNAFLSAQKIQGSIINPESEKIFILNRSSNVVFSADVDLKTGTFSDIFKKECEPGFYTLKYGHETTSMYLKPSFDLTITLDTREFDESISYSGTGAEYNNFLAKKFLLEEQGYGNLGKLYSSNETDFLKKLNTVQKKEEKLLANLSDNDFVKQERQAIKYHKLVFLLNYQSYHAYLTHNNTFKVSASFLAPIDSIDYDNETDFLNSKDYQELVNKYYTDPVLSSQNIKDAILKIEHIKSPIIKSAEMNQLLRFIAPSLGNLDSINWAVQNYMTDKDFKEKIAKKIDACKNVSKGHLSPSFSYKDIDGNTVSLSDFKGKLVYIDVWATWCAPCRREIPFLKKMAKTYEGKAIEFVSISVDNKSAYDKWKKMVKSQTDNWHQLFADKSWNSDFTRAYMINSIPRFILIDKEGKIVSPDATRPSNPVTSKIIDDLLAN